MANLASTVPGAITTLKGYMTSVAAASAVPDVQVYLGKQATETQLAFNFLMVGDFHNGIPVAPGTYRWAYLPARGTVRESYALSATICCWAGGYDPTARLTDAYSLLNALQLQVRSDPGGGGTLSPSGSWGDMDVRMEWFGAEQTGWGVALCFELHVINALLTT